MPEGKQHILALSHAVPGRGHDTKLSDTLQTVARLPEGCETDADKGDQGLSAQVTQVTGIDSHTGAAPQVPRLQLKTPFKKPQGQELTDAQKAFNTQLNTIRVRIAHCLGWVKNWAIIATRFRCAHPISTAILRTVGGLVNTQTQRWQAAKAACCA